MKGRGCSENGGAMEFMQILGQGKTQARTCSYPTVPDRNDAHLMFISIGIIIKNTVSQYT